MPGFKSTEINACFLKLSYMFHTHCPQSVKQSCAVSGARYMHGKITHPEKAYFNLHKESYSTQTISQIQHPACRKSGKKKWGFVIFNQQTRPSPAISFQIQIKVQISTMQSLFSVLLHQCTSGDSWRLPSCIEWSWTTWSAWHVEPFDPSLQVFLLLCWTLLTALLTCNFHVTLGKTKIKCPSAP